MGDTQCMTSGIILVSLAHLCYVSRYCLNQWTDSRMQRQIWLTYKKKKRKKRAILTEIQNMCFQPLLQLSLAYLILQETYKAA